MSYSKVIREDLLAVPEPPTAYRVGWAGLVRQLLPPALRRARMVAWLQVLVSAVDKLHQRFITYLYTARRETSYNSQVLLFERALNDRFDAFWQRIRIRNTDTEFTIGYDHFRGETAAEGYMYQRREWPAATEPLRPLQGTWEADRWWAEFGGQTDFVVDAPAYLYPRAAEMHALIRRLKLATKQYTLTFPAAVVVEANPQQ